jgi:TPR repeat protein
MQSSRRFSICISTILVCTGLSAGADLASANRALEQKDYAAALKEFTVLAEQGDAGAQLAVGRMYMLGSGVKQDREQAAKWLKAAATQSNSDAQFFLGAMYLLPQTDIAEGVRWLRLAAEQGNQDAQYLLGKTYLQGAKEIPRDQIQCAMWLLLAAKGNKEFYQDELNGAERQLTPEQVAKAKELAAAWKPSSQPGRNQ